MEPSLALLQMAKDKAAALSLTNLDFRAANAESVEGLPEGHFQAATIRWGLMAMTSPVAALANARRALVPTGVLVAALWAESERVPYYTLPRALLGRYRALPGLDPEAPGTFRYANVERIARDFKRAGFTLDCVEEMETTVVEAKTSQELIALVVGLGLAPLLNALAESDRQAWERDMTQELESLRSDGLVRLGGVTRIVRARLAEGPGVRG